MAYAALSDIRLSRQREGGVRHELLGWLRLLAWAVGAVAIAGVLIAFAPSALQLVALR